MLILLRSKCPKRLMSRVFLGCNFDTQTDMHVHIINIYLYIWYIFFLKLICILIYNSCMGYIYIITTQLEEIQVLLQITSALVGSFAWCRNLQPESFLELLTLVFTTNFMRESKHHFDDSFWFTSFFHPWHHTTCFFLEKHLFNEGVQMSCSPPLQVDRTFAFASGDTGPPGETVAAGNLLETLGDGPQMNPNIRTLKFFF